MYEVTVAYGVRNGIQLRRCLFEFSQPRMILREVGMGAVVLGSCLDVFRAKIQRTAQCMLHFVGLAWHLLINHSLVAPKQVPPLFPVNRGLYRRCGCGIPVLEKVDHSQGAVERRSRLDAKSLLQLIYGLREAPLDAVESSQSPVCNRIV